MPLTRQDSIFGKLPIEKEKELSNEILEDLGEGFSRIFLPTVVFQKQIVKQKLTGVVNKLEELGI
jgi:hypothetical protein